MPVRFILWRSLRLLWHKGTVLKWIVYVYISEAGSNQTVCL